MRVSLTRPGEKSWVNGIDEDVTPTELAELWRGGAMVSARPKEANSNKTKPTLDCADVAMVAVNLVALPMEHILTHPFAQWFLTVAAYSGNGTSGMGLLAFRLSKPTTDGRHLTMVMKGLETLYAGSEAHGSILQGFGMVGLDTLAVPGGRLSVAAEKELAMLGRETHEFSARQYQASPPRSRFNLERWSVIQLPYGAEDLLGRVSSETIVYCPVHVDREPKAMVVHGKDGAPIVMCSRCHRSFGLDRTRRYDFNHSDRVFAELAAQEDRTRPADSTEPRQYTVTQEKYLPPIPVLPGITLVQSGKGTGKTTQLVRVVEECKARKLKVLLIGHRRTLLQSLANTVGLTNYFELVEEIVKVGDDDADDCVNLKWELMGIEAPVRRPRQTVVVSAEVNSVAPTSYYAISLDSLGTLQPNQNMYDVVIIDECEQVFSHLVSKTLSEKRSSVYLRLRHYLRMAESVYLLDADLNMVTMDTLFQIGKRDDTPVNVFINHPVQQQGTTYFYASDRQVVDRFTKSVANGEKCYVATNSIGEAEALALAAVKARADARVICVTSKNSQTPEVQRLIGNIAKELEHNIDVLIASPALGTGVDISYRDVEGKPRSVVQKVFGIFKRNITTHFDIDQAIMRVREPGEVHVWVDSWKHFYECEPAMLRKMLEDSVQDTHRLIDFDDKGDPILAPDDGLVDIWARISAASRGSRNELADLYKALRRRNGYQITLVGLDEEAQAAGGQLMKSMRETLRAERADALMAAEIIESREAKDISTRDQNGEIVTDEERLQLDRYRIEKFHCQGLSLELIAFDDNGRVRDKIRNFECLSQPVARLIRQDGEENELLFPFDRRLQLLRRKLLSNLLGAAGIYDSKTSEFSTTVTVEQNTLTAFARQIWLYRGRMELAFGLVVRRDAKTKPMIQLREVLKLVGLSMEDDTVQQVGGRKIRAYRLAEASVGDIVAVVERREEDRKQWLDDEPADKSEHVVHKETAEDLSGQNPVGDDAPKPLPVNLEAVTAV